MVRYQRNRTIRICIDGGPHLKHRKPHHCHPHTIPIRVSYDRHVQFENIEWQDEEIHLRHYYAERKTRTAEHHILSQI